MKNPVRTELKRAPECSLPKCPVSEINDQRETAKDGRSSDNLRKTIRYRFREFAKKRTRRGYCGTDLSNKSTDKIQGFLVELLQTISQHPFCVCADTRFKQRAAETRVTERQTIREKRGGSLLTIGCGRCKESEPRVGEREKVPHFLLHATPTVLSNLLWRKTSAPSRRLHGFLLESVHLLEIFLKFHGRATRILRIPMVGVRAEPT